MEYFLNWEIWEIVRDYRREIESNAWKLFSLILIFFLWKYTLFGSLYMVAADLTNSSTYIKNLGGWTLVYECDESSKKKVQRFFA